MSEVKVGQIRRWLDNGELCKVTSEIKCGFKLTFGVCLTGAIDKNYIEEKTELVTMDNTP